MLLDISRWKTYIKPFLNDDLCVFRNLEHVKIASFWWFLVVFSRNMRFLERIWRVHIYHILHFLSYTNCKKVWKFYPFLFVGTVLSPPPYETRSLCSGCKLIMLFLRIQTGYVNQLMAHFWEQKSPHYLKYGGPTCEAKNRSDATYR